MQLGLVLDGERGAGRQRLDEHGIMMRDACDANVQERAACLAAFAISNVRSY